MLATTNQTLESLLLRLNGITDVGASALASALIENETLLCIDLGHNIIGNKGAMGKFLLFQKIVILGAELLLTNIMVNRFAKGFVMQRNY